MFDLNKILEAAVELGINMKANSANPGFHFVASNATTESVSYDELEQIIIQKFSSTPKIQYNTITSKSFTCDIEFGDSKVRTVALPMHIKVKVGEDIAEALNNIEIANLDSQDYHNYNTITKNNKAA